MSANAKKILANLVYYTLIGVMVAFVVFFVICFVNSKSSLKYETSPLKDEIDVFTKELIFETSTLIVSILLDNISMHYFVHIVSLRFKSDILIVLPILYSLYSNQPFLDVHIMFTSYTIYKYVHKKE